MRHSAWRLVTVMAVVTLICACAKPTVRERYGELDSEMRDFFIAYYPDLNHQQRKSLLDHPESPDLLLESWNVPLKKPGDLRLARQIESFAVLPSNTEPLTKNTYVELHGFLTYKDGRHTEVTNDVQWRVEPSPSWMDGSILRFGCQSADVTVVASFLSEPELTRTYSIRKKVRALRITVDESSQVMEASEYVKLKAIAYCADGSESDVTCQVSWQPDPDAARISGCGYLHLLSKQPVHEGFARVGATYGGVTRVERVPLPRKEAP
jgi:hypothetical protein